MTCIFRKNILLFDVSIVDMSNIDTSTNNFNYKGDSLL